MHDSESVDACVEGITSTEAVFKDPSLGDKATSA